MSHKFLRRTFRNVIVRNHPYFAHLAITHRCNLRCSFCHIPETKFAELDTDGMKRVIDRLDSMGIAVLSISGGGEPLVRADFAEIIDYAASRGMYTKLTSNGTMPRARYERLLASRIKEIGISLDGVSGNQLPFAHVGPPILDTLQYLNDNLPAGKSLTINVTVTEDNREQLDAILRHCANAYPRARVWLNPVMSGDGALRTDSVKPAPPTYMRTVQSPTRLTARFYTEAVERQFENPKFDWGCEAGRLFFDIKPNGDLWLCQDVPSRTPLNILDPDFIEKWRAANFDYRRECSGCTYSCYYVPQSGFQPRNWPDMGALWWQANTHPGDRCRAVAVQHGWLAGLLVFLLDRKRLAPAVAAIVLLLLSGALATGAEPAPPPRNPEQLLACMESANEVRQRKLQPYRSERVYTAYNSFLKRGATTVAEVVYTPPGKKEFRVLQTRGSAFVHKRVILPLLETECRNAAPEARSHTDIHRRNYRFVFVEIEKETGDYVFLALPRTKHRYLFRGRIFVDPRTCGIRRTAGAPAVSPSFWVKQVAFTHQYRLLDSFWVPDSHHTDVKLKVVGRSSLDIHYAEHEWLNAPSGVVQSARATPVKR